MRNEESPRASHQPFVKFVRPAPNSPLTVRPLARAAAVSRMHRIGGRSIPCLPEPCPFCAAREPLDNRVYLLAEPQGECSIVFVDLPSAHFAQLDELFNASGCLSKYMLRISRLGPHANSPIGIRPVGRFSDSADIFLQTWVDAVLDRNFSSNLSKALVSMVGVEKPATTFARAATSDVDATPGRVPATVSSAANFRAAMKQYRNT